MSVLQRAKEVHFAHGGKPGLMEQAVCLVQTVIVRRFGLGQGRVGVGPATDESPLFRRAVGREIPQHPGLHGGALIDELIHDLPVEPGNGSALVRHDLHQPLFLQFLQHHPDEGAGGPKAGAERVLAQGAARPDGQVNDLSLQHLVNFSISFVLFHDDSPKRKALLRPTSPSSSLCSMPPLLAGEALAEVISF